MNRKHFWLTEAQFERLAPLLPADTRGKPRVDDRRVISGIVHVLKSGCRWKDTPDTYGPHKTLYNRFVRWTAKGVWIDVFHALSSAGGPPAAVLIDSSAVKAHRCTSGGKGGAEPGDQAVPRRTDHQDTRPHRRDMPPDRLPADGRADRRLLRRRSASRGDAGPPDPACRQGLRHERHPPAGRGSRRDAEHPTEGQPSLEELLLALPLPRPSTSSQPSASRRRSATGYASRP